MTTKNIAIVAHDRMKKELIKWVEKHQTILKRHILYATGSSGLAIEKTLNMSIHKMDSGPLGGDQQLGAKIVNKEIDMLIFFWGPLEAQSQDPDIRTLLRIAVVWNLPVACNRPPPITYSLHRYLRAITNPSFPLTNIIESVASFSKQKFLEWRTCQLERLSTPNQPVSCLTERVLADQSQSP